VQTNVNFSNILQVFTLYIYLP